MERVYYIDHVSNDDINALSLKLNSMQEVSHIKINKILFRLIVHDQIIYKTI